MAIREDKSKLPTGAFQVDGLPLAADTDVTLGVSTSQFALLGQPHVFEDTMRDTLYGAVRSGNTVAVGELTGDHPDVSRPDPSGVTTLVTQTAQNRDAEDRDQRQRFWATEASSFMGTGESLKPDDTRVLMMLGNPFLAFAAEQLLSLPQYATADEAIAHGDYARAAALRNAEHARERADGINQDGTVRLPDRQPGQAADGTVADNGAATTTPHFENGQYYDSYGGRYDNYGYKFKDGSYKDIDDNFYDAKTKTITAGDTHAKIEVPAGLHESAEDIIRKTHERLDGAAAAAGHALTAANTNVAGGPPSHSAAHDAHPQPGSQWAHRVAGEADLRETIRLEQAAQATREAIFQQAAHGGSTGLQAVSADEAQNKVGFVHETPSTDKNAAPAKPAAAATVGPSASEATWYSDGKGGYFDNLGGYYDTKGGYWDAKGGYTDAKGGFTDPKGGYTWPDKSYLDANFNYVDKDGNLTTAQGDHFKARPGVDFKAELQDAATNGTAWTPPAMGAGDTPAAWKQRLASADDVKGGAATKQALADVSAAVPITPVTITPLVAGAVANTPRITPIEIPASASPLSSTILSGINLTTFQMTTPAPDTNSNFSLFSNFRDSFDTAPATGKFATNFTVPLLDLSASPAPAANSPAATSKTPATPAPKAT